MNIVISQLESVGITCFDDEMKALLVLSGLPKSWGGVVTVVSNSAGKDKLGYDNVVSTILGEEMRRKSSGSSKSSDSVLYVEQRGRSADRKNGNKGRGRSKSKSKWKKKDMKDIECYNCGESGHFARACKNQSKKKPENHKGTDSINISESDQEALILSVLSKEDVWIVDSGASFHATGRKDILHNYVHGDFGKVYLGDDEACKIVGKGEVQLNLDNGTALQLTGVRHVPNLKRNLISVGQLAASGCKTTFGVDSWKVTRGSMVIAHGKKEGTLYVTSGTDSTIAVASSDIGASTWHHRLGHMSEKGMKIMLKRGKLKGLKELDLEFCEDCVYGKQKRVSFTKFSRERKLNRLELVHTDVWGPAKVASNGGASYFVTFIDDATRKLWVYFLRNKSDVFDVFKKWKATVENETG